MASFPLRIVFAGTPEFAAAHLAELLASEHRVVAVYTQPDRPAGRGKRLQASPVKKLADDSGVAVQQPASLRQAEEWQRLAALQADVLVVVAYGLILPPEVLAIPRLGCLNVHASLLPRWRGAAPIQRAIAAGDSHSGITIMQMDAGLDTGAMLATASCAIAADTNAASLHEQLAILGAPLLLQVLSDLPAYQSRASMQNDDDATYADKIDKAEAEIDWQLDALVLDRLVRAFNPFPVCYSPLAGERVKLWQASPRPDADNPAPPGTIVSAGPAGIAVQCGRGQLDITRLQLPGGRAMSAADMLNARAERFAPGLCFGQAD